ncbi:hypothetical protein [Microbacterium sp. YJN-G]|uniref:hypothetical protein n=1 Tax=Microbacterium sp. YJN-G TaxID=2763257 RepID=UPI001878B042|nr:hypothetical protein [Microbacterium sp. YJN-G]
MSDEELTITSGGTIAIDSSMVRDIGRRLHGVGTGLAEAVERLRSARAALDQAPAVERAGGAAGIAECAARLAGWQPQIDKIAQGAAAMADTFELVELRAQQQALNEAYPAAAEALQPRIDELLTDPHIEDRATWAVAEWQRTRFEGTEDQPWDLIALGISGILSMTAPGVMSPLIVALATRPVATTARIGTDAAVRLDRGVLPFGTRLQGTAPPLHVALVGAGTAEPPTKLSESLGRIPYERAGQIVVERYAMKDGSARFVTYLDGTRRFLPGSDEPWDMGSNWDLYIDRELAASQQATLTALKMAGAEPGDRVDLVTYSQGGAIGSITAMDSPYETGVVISAGNPTEPSLAADQTLVQLRHEGDLVSNLSAGGSFGGTGAPESFTASRAVGGKFGPFDPHAFEGYLETARMVDTSGDPRVSALQSSFYAELGEADSVERMEFRAERP